MTHSTSCSFDALYGCYSWILCCVMCKSKKKTTQVMLIRVVIYSKPSHLHNSLHGRQRVILKSCSIITTDQTTPVAETDIGPVS